MENVEVEEQEVTSPSNTCANCGCTLNFTSGKTPLCEDCRNLYIKYPIPVWIKGFGIGILAILIFSLFSLSKNLQTGIHYNRGLTASKNKNYLTAEKEFREVVKKEPDYKEAKSYLLIAAFYNDDIQTVTNTFQQLKDEQFDQGDDLFNQVDYVLSKTVTCIPSDSFMTVLQKHNTEIDSISDAEYKSYLSKNNSDIFAAASYASLLQDEKRYRESDSLLSVILAVDPEYNRALSLKIPAKREQNQIDSAYYYIDQLLKINHEDVYALSSKVRVLLKEKKDEEALQLAKECLRMDDKNVYALGSIALAYHFKNDLKSRDAVIASLSKDSTSAGMLSYIKDVITGKETFRN